MVALNKLRLLYNIPGTGGVKSKLSVDKMPVDKMSVDTMSVDTMSVDKM
jgi:hypothetical protein